MSPSPCNADELADRRDAMRADIGRTTIAEEQEVCRASFPRPNVRLPTSAEKPGCQYTLIPSTWEMKVRRSSRAIAHLTLPVGFTL